MSGAETSDPAHARQYGKDGAHLPTWECALHLLAIWVWAIRARPAHGEVRVRPDGEAGMYPNTSGGRSIPRKAGRMRECPAYGKAGDVPESKRGQECFA